MVTPTPTTVQVKIQLRIDPAATWASVNPILLAGEMGLETDTNKFKIGNGSTAWNSLGYFPFVVSGGTVTGNLEIGSTGTLTFEGSTADNFETTLGVINPTADRTINLPNVSGTIITTGDTGTVTSAMIADGAIVDADISGTAEISVSKLADGAARQLLQTDAAGTGVEWTSNVDIPGTLDVTSDATFDSNVTIAGDLTVNGTTTTINTQDLLVEDKNIIIGNVTTPDDTTANAGGITLKGASDKTINWYDATDAWTSSERFSVPLGSAASPSLTFTGDENTGIYSPGADQLALSTNGTGRLFVDSDGRVLAGTASTTGYNCKTQIRNDATNLHLELIASNSSNTGGPALFLSKSRGTASTPTISSNGDAVGYLAFSGHDGTAYRQTALIASALDGTPGANVMPGRLVFSTTPSASGATPQERLRITSAGLVGIGNSSPLNTLVVQGPSSDGTSSSDQVAEFTGPGRVNGFVVFVNDTNNNSGIQTRSGDALIINPNGGNVGIGTTTVGAKLHIAGATGGGIAGIWDTAAGGARIEYKDNGTRRGYFNWDTNSLYLAADSGNSIKFSTNAGVTQHATIDSSGRLLVGTSSYSADTRAVFRGTGASPTTQARIILQRGSANPGSVQGIGDIVFADSNEGIGASIGAFGQAGWNSPSDCPGNLVFSTTADGASSPTERMRINSSGAFKATTTGSHVSTTDQTHAFLGGGTGATVEIRNNNSTTFNSYVLTLHADRQTTNSTYNFLQCNMGGVGSKLLIRDSGNVVNTNNSYGAISDIKLKENIVDANSQWSDIKALQVRNYNFKKGQTHTQLGLIAQEVELVSPGLVSESPDRDEDGNDLGTVTKSVNYSVLYMKAVKALQEAMERIETLEAKVAALESA